MKTWSTLPVSWHDDECRECGHTMAYHLDSHGSLTDCYANARGGSFCGCMTYKAPWKGKRTNQKKEISK